jgi:hypothetical protein
VLEQWKENRWQDCAKGMCPISAEPKASLTPLFSAQAFPHTGYIRDN